MGSSYRPVIRQVNMTTQAMLYTIVADLVCNHEINTHTANIVDTKTVFAIHCYTYALGLTERM